MCAFWLLTKLICIPLYPAIFASMLSFQWDWFGISCKLLTWCCGLQNRSLRPFKATRLRFFLEFHNSLEYGTPIDTPNAILDFQKVLQEFVQTKTLRRFGKSPFKFHQDQEVKSPFSSLLTTHPPIQVHPSPSNSDSIRWIRSSTSTDSSASTSPRWKAATKEATVWCGRAECNSSIAWLSFVEKHEQRIATILTQVVELVLISIYFWR